MRYDAAGGFMAEQAFPLEGHGNAASFSAKETGTYLIGVRTTDPKMGGRFILTTDEFQGCGIGCGQSEACPAGSSCSAPSYPHGRSQYMGKKQKRYEEQARRMIEARGYFAECRPMTDLANTSH